ncbi:hypothetical protein [Pseudomonas schmalbachii]|uniref:Transmembrane protein n=1 Tax=Pseudomonas schmalbachii TaxID=2816993 RepID=A0ABS3TJ59_9PSED|nr:hypothetical protein [Pseudomonas schmalbachii]MBO3273682.1 hypothetical protein [Pseudomonas schmalbachii]
MKKDDFILLLAGLGGAGGIIALSIPLVLAFMQPKPVKLTGSPESFTFDYPHGEFAGERSWSQIGKGIWRETLPHGRNFTKFKEIRRTNFGRCKATIVEREDAPNFKIFIADRDCEKQWLYYQVGNEEWQFMGVMKSVK